MKMLRAISIVLFISFLAIGCGSSGGGGDDTQQPSTKKTTVSGTVLDDNGNPIEGAEVTIMSDPVTETTNANGFFSATVEIGTHTIEIKKDAVLIYLGQIECKENTPLNIPAIKVGSTIASGSYSNNSQTGVLTFDTEHTDYICGPEIGTVTLNVIYLTSTTLTLEDTDGYGHSTWTRNGGSNGELVGTWKASIDDDNSWELIFASNDKWLLTVEGDICDDPEPYKPPSPKTTTVSGTVLDLNNNPIEGAAVTIMSDPVTVTTDANGVFSATVEIGTHTLEIKMGSILIHTEQIVCEENTPLHLSNITTNYDPDDDRGPTPDITAPSIPSNVNAITVSTSQINVTWSASTDNKGVYGYRIIRTVPLPEEVLAIIPSTSSSYSYSHTDLTVNVQYCYNITAFDDAGNESDRSLETCTETSMTDTGGIAAATSNAIDMVTVRMIVSGPEMANHQKDFPATAGKVTINGIINGIPAGTDRTVIFQGLDSDGIPMYEGNKTSITVVPGQITDAGYVEMNPITN